MKTIHIYQAEDDNFYFHLRDYYMDTGAPDAPTFSLETAEADGWVGPFEDEVVLNKALDHVEAELIAAHSEAVNNLKASLGI